MRLRLKVLTGLVLTMLCFGIAGCDRYYADSEKRTPGEVADDTTIATAIKTRLIRGQATHGWRLNVDVNRGVVSLTGFVQSQAERMAALDIARRTKGVVEVRDNLTIVTSGSLPPATEASEPVGAPAEAQRPDA
ncbi:MAG: BON domain-containing protein [Pseudomonadota bacterium]